ncbi:MAG: hypothetical protein HKN54_10110 [Flavobacteriaceae bacterium]|nr:hypothetical protein [Flavobacteriaceae bacterium]
MLKSKWFVFLLFGLALGVGIFLFVRHSIDNDFSQFDQDEKIEQNLRSESQIKNVSVANDNATTDPVIEKSSEYLIPPVEKSLETFQTDSSANTNMELLFEYRANRDARNKDKKAKAKVIWNEFIKNQPHELKALIPETREEGAWNVGMSDFDKGHYLKHFEGSRSDWGSKAISALGNYFKAQAYPNHYILRIDCRQSMCEIAGVIQNIEVFPDEYSRTLSILSSRWEEVTRYMVNSYELSELFELRGKANMNYALPDEAGVFAIPYSVFLYRNYVISPVSGPN